MRYLLDTRVSFRTSSQILTDVLPESRMPLHAAWQQAVVTIQRIGNSPRDWSCAMKYLLRVAFHAALTCAFSSLVWAGCVGRSVNAFGAKGDGHTDDTAAIQKAINAVAASGGGSVVFNVARYYTTGTFVVPNSVVLCGVSRDHLMCRE